MSRPKRELRKKFVIFCEGDTEYNYIDAMRLKQGVELDYLNAGDNSCHLMLSRLRKKIVINRYRVNKSNFEIKITGTEFVWENGNERGSNINEFFEIIDW